MTDSVVSEYIRNGASASCERLTHSGTRESMDQRAKANESLRRQKKNTKLVRTELEGSLNRVRKILQNYRKTVQQNNPAVHKDELIGEKSDSEDEGDGDHLAGDSLTSTLRHIRRWTHEDSSRSWREREQFLDSVTQSKRDMHEVLTSRIAMHSAQSGILRGLLRQVSQYRAEASANIFPSVDQDTTDREDKKVLKDIDDAIAKSRFAKRNLHTMSHRLLSTSSDVREQGHDKEEQFLQLQENYRQVVQSRDELASEVLELRDQVEQLQKKPSSQTKSKNRRSSTRSHKSIGESCSIAKREIQIAIAPCTDESKLKLREKPPLSRVTQNLCSLLP